MPEPLAIRTPDQRLRVFISSTLGELADERRAARAAVEQLRLTPILFELGARPHPPRALYRSYLAQSDVFVGIYWERYGWVAPDMEVSGLEDELQLSEGMPRLIYVKRPAPDMEPRLAEMLGRLEGESSASYKPFHDVEELGALLVDDLALLLTERFGRASAPRDTEGPRTILPSPMSTFLGREAILSQVQRLVTDHAERLITLSGPGGTGKTRLAVQAARAVVDAFDDGVVFVDLSAERAPDEVFTAIGRTLAVGGTDDLSPLDALRAALRDRHLLLVLDNFEQVTAAAPGVVELLQHCPRLTVLVTSREALRVTGEHLVPVAPLSLPGTGSTAVDEVLASEAGRLFAERAAAVSPGFEVTVANAGDVAAICHRLDGLPLAIELAAAQVRLLSIGELRARLEQRLDLTGGARDLPARQQTLRSTIEWSHALLTEPERLTFSHVSVFANARLPDIEATFAAVPALAGIDVVDALSGLVDKSLVRVTTGVTGRPRLSMLHTIRRYAAEQLASDPDEALATKTAHANHYLQVAVELHGQLTLADRAAVLAALGDEQGNLRAAWDHLVQQQDVACLDDLLEPLWGYHEARGDYRAIIGLGEDLLRVLAELPDTPERKHDELTLHTNLARTQLAVRGFTPEAERTMSEALDRYEASSEARHRFATLRSLASLRLMRYELDLTAAAARELMEIAETETDPALLTEAHLMAAVTTYWSEDVSDAIAHLDQAIASFQQARSGFVEFRVGPNPGVVAHAVAGLLRWTAGLTDSAVARMEDSVRVAKELDHPYSVAYALHHATLLDLWRQDFPSMTARSEESLRLTETHDYPVWRALAFIFHGTAKIASGRPDDGLTEIEEGFAIYADLATPPVFWPMILMIRASAYGMAGKLARALDLMADAERSLSELDPQAADMAVARADLLVRTAEPDLAAAEALLEHAWALSARRGARMLELEALVRLARVQEGTDRRPHTLNRLGSVYDRFTEGFDTPQLETARAILDRA